MMAVSKLESAVNILVMVVSKLGAMVCKLETVVGKLGSLPLLWRCSALCCTPCQTSSLRVDCGSRYMPAPEMLALHALSEQH